MGLDSRACWECVQVRWTKSVGGWEACNCFVPLRAYPQGWWARAENVSTLQVGGASACARLCLQPGLLNVLELKPGEAKRSVPLCP